MHGSESRCAWRAVHRQRQQPACAAARLRLAAPPGRGHGASSRACFHSRGEKACKVGACMRRIPCLPFVKPQLATRHAKHCRPPGTRHRRARAPAATSSPPSLPTSCTRMRAHTTTTWWAGLQLWNEGGGGRAGASSCRGTKISVITPARLLCRRSGASRAARTCTHWGLMEDAVVAHRAAWRACIVHPCRAWRQRAELQRRVPGASEPSTRGGCLAPASRAPEEGALLVDGRPLVLASARL